MNRDPAACLVVCLFKIAGQRKIPGHRIPRIRIAVARGHIEIPTRRDTTCWGLLQVPTFESVLGPVQIVISVGTGFVQFFVGGKSGVSIHKQ